MSLLMRQFGRPGAQRRLYAAGLFIAEGAGRRRPQQQHRLRFARSRCRSGARPEGKVGLGSAAAAVKSERFRCGRQRGANEGAKRQRQPLNFTGFAAAIGPHGQAAARRANQRRNMPWPIVVRLRRRQPKRSGAQLIERRQTVEIAIGQPLVMRKLSRCQHLQRLQPRQQRAFDVGSFSS